MGHRDDRDQDNKDRGGEDQDPVGGGHTDGTGRTARSGADANRGRQLCPTCHGRGDVPRFFAGVDEDGGFSTNRLVCCGTCDGAGSVRGRSR